MNMLQACLIPVPVPRRRGIIDIVAVYRTACRNLSRSLYTRRCRMISWQDRASSLVSSLTTVWTHQPLGQLSGIRPCCTATTGRNEQHTYVSFACTVREHRFWASATTARHRAAHYVRASSCCRLKPFHDTARMCQLLSGCRKHVMLSTKSCPAHHAGTYGYNSYRCGRPVQSAVDSP
jgi:hypothetical protein